MTDPDFQPGCTNPHCVCRRPGRVCDEFAGPPGTEFCPCCGWHRRWHATTATAAPNGVPD